MTRRKKTNAKKPPARRRAIGEDPLDILMAIPPRVDLATKASRRGLARAGPETGLPAPKPKAPAKVRATFHLPEGLVQEATDAVLFMRGAGKPTFTLASLAETALERELSRLRKAHNKGKAFPRSNQRLKGGRPLKATT